MINPCGGGAPHDFNFDMMDAGSEQSFFFNNSYNIPQMAQLLNSFNDRSAFEELFNSTNLGH